MENSLPTIRNYFNSCLAEDCEPCFQDFIVKYTQHIIANLNNSQNPYSDLLTLFMNQAKALGIKANKGAAQKAWKKHIEGQVASKKSKVLCPVGEEEAEEAEVKGDWKAGDYDVVALFNQERKAALAEKKSGQFITEQRYLLLSFVLEVPLSTKNFVFGSEGQCLKMMRAALLPQTRKAQFEQDILLMFLNAKKAWEAKDEDEDEDEDEGDEDDEDVDYQIYKMTRQAKKSKKKEEDALSRVLGAFLGKFRSWKEVCKTKEVFIDQHLYPFLDNIFFQDEQYDYTRSYGVIPCNTNTNTSSKRKMKATASPSPSSSSAAAAKTTTKSRTIDTAKPDFFLFRPSDDEEFGLLCVKVKKPGCSVTQSLSDRSKLALEMKRSIDHQAILGIQSPKCFGILVDGLVVSSFAAQLSSCGIYSVLELEEFSLLRGKSDLGILPDIVLSFCWIKNLVDEAAAMMTKRRRTTSGSSRLLRPTVALPVQKRSCE